MGRHRQHNVPARGDVVRPEHRGGGVVEGGTRQTKVTDLEPKGERGVRGGKVRVR